MLIFTKQVDWEKLKRKTRKPDEAITYVENLVPKWARHIQNIVNNQRYYAAVYMRNVYALPYKERMAITLSLTDGISLTGLTASFIALDELLQVCNKDELLGALVEISNVESID